MHVWIVVASSDGYLQTFVAGLVCKQLLVLQVGEHVPKGHEDGLVCKLSSVLQVIGCVPKGHEYG